MKKGKIIIPVVVLVVIAIALVFLLSVGIAPAGEYKGKAIKARLASVEIEGDFMTAWARNFSAHMKEWSNGKIDINVYPYGTLGALGDINELAQMGVVEYVFSDYAWISSFVPQAQVLALNYLFPTEKVPEVLDWMARNGEVMPLMEKAFRKNGLVPLSIMFEGWQWLSSKTKVESLNDLKGLKIRVMSSKLLVEDYKAYGIVPTPMDYGEIYSGLQMGRGAPAVPRNRRYLTPPTPLPDRVPEPPSVPLPPRPHRTTTGTDAD